MTNSAVSEDHAYLSVEKKILWPRLAGIFLMISGLVIAVLLAVLLVEHQDGIISPLGKVLNMTSFIPPTTLHTTDHYPPGPHFPPALEPKFPRAELEITERYLRNRDGITALAYAAMDRDSGELLVAKNLTQQLPIASVTKVMTAIVALETAPLQLKIKVSDEAMKVGEASMGLTSGEVVSLETLLYGMMLPSGNDAAETISEGSFGFNGLQEDDPQVRIKKRTTFIGAMNKKAHSIGMYDTFFSNPSGLDEATIEQSNHSTVLDLLALGHYALQNPVFSQVVGTKNKVFEAVSGEHKAFYLSNILDLSKSYPGVKGIKPGNTDYAGETLLSYAENGNKRIILALLGSQRTKDDAVKIYDYLFDSYNIPIPCIGQMSIKCKPAR